MHLLVVEDQRLLRDLLLHACRNLPPFTRISAVGAPQAALHTLATDPADVVALSLRLPGCEPAQLAAEITTRWPRARLVALGDGSPEPCLWPPTSHAFHGWVDTRADPPERLREALLRVACGRRYLSPSLRALQRRLGATPDALYKLLTDRERDLLPLLGQGLTNGELAMRLDISPHTAQVHRRNIMRKVRVQTTPQLIYFALQHGFLRMPR